MLSGGASGEYTVATSDLVLMHLMALHAFRLVMRSSTTRLPIRLNALYGAPRFLTKTVYDLSDIQMVTS